MPTTAVSTFSDRAVDRAVDRIKHMTDAEREALFERLGVASVFNDAAARTG